MKLEVKNNCPLNGFEPCKQFDCAWWIQIKGKDPQTEKEFDDYACSIAWMPILLIENSMQQHRTGAAVESFRNEMVKANNASHNLLKVATEMNSGVKLIDMREVE